MTAAGSLTLNGTTIAATGDGSGGLYVNGTGGVLNASNLTITTHGGVDESTGQSATGAYNGSYDDQYVGGGTMTLTNVAITTSGDTAKG